MKVQAGCWRLGSVKQHTIFLCRSSAELGVVALQISEFGHEHKSLERLARVLEPFELVTETRNGLVRRVEWTKPQCINHSTQLGWVARLRMWLVGHLSLAEALEYLLLELLGLGSLRVWPASLRQTLGLQLWGGLAATSCLPLRWATKRSLFRDWDRRCRYQRCRACDRRSGRCSLL